MLSLTQLSLTLFLILLNNICIVETILLFYYISHPDSIEFLITAFRYNKILILESYNFEDIMHIGTSSRRSSKSLFS